MKLKPLWLIPTAITASVIVMGCGGGPADIPQLSAASPAALANCTALTSSFSFPVLPSSAPPMLLRARLPMQVKLLASTAW